MRVLAYYPLHYGLEYLEASIKSIHPFVDKIIILYAKEPSFGHHTDIPCPESEWILKSIAEVASHKVEWIDISGTSEGEHRNIIFQHTKDYDLLLAVDADEVWNPSSLVDVLMKAYSGTAHRYNIAGFLNFWKSFNHVCTDGFTPARIYNLNNHDGEGILEGLVYHFGYAQALHTIEYKIRVHGHRDIREGWLEMYKTWTPEVQYLHPASNDIWVTAEPFDKSKLPAILKEHPNFNKETI
jgi:glycosyltransferase involved in cell wall biosynthesis